MTVERGRQRSSSGVYLQDTEGELITDAQLHNWTYTNLITLSQYCPGNRATGYRLLTLLGIGIIGGREINSI